MTTQERQFAHVDALLLRKFYEGVFGVLSPGRRLVLMLLLFCIRAGGTLGQEQCRIRTERKILYILLE